MQHQKFSEWCNKVIRFSFYALIYFLPISTALVETFASLALVTFFIKRGASFYYRLREDSSKGLSLGGKIKLFLQSYKPATSSLSWPIGIFIFFNFISALMSQHPSYSFSAFFFKILQETFIFFTFFEGFKTKKQLGIFIAVFFTSSFLVATNATAQLVNGIGFIRGNLPNRLGRIRSCFRHANDFGSFLIVSISLLISMIMLWMPTLFKKGKEILTKEEKKKLLLFNGVTILAVAFFLAMIVFLGLTLSRGAWMGFSIALLFIGLRGRSKRTFFFIIALLAAFFVLFNTKLGTVRSIDIFSDRIGQNGLESEKQKDLALSVKEEKTADISGYTDKKIGHVEPVLSEKEKGGLNIFSLIEKSGGQGRANYWKEAIAIIKDYPLFGAGVNTYTQIAPHYRLSWQGGIYPHNCYLQMTAEIGVFGLLSFLWIIFSVSVTSIRNIRLIKDPFLSSIVIGLIGGLFGFLIHAFLDTPLYSVQLNSLMWLAIGVIMCAQRMSPGVEDNYAARVENKAYHYANVRFKEILNVTEQKEWVKTGKYVLKGCVFYVAIFLIIFVVLFSIGEICFRVFKGSHNPLINLTQKKSGFLFKPNSTEHSISSVPGEFDYVAHINNFGYRGKDFQWLKYNETTRIFVVGDSFTFGVGASEDETIPSLLEKYLLKNKIGAEVINAGVGHASPITHYVNLREIHLKYEPNLVILLFDLTDLWDDWHSERNAVLDNKGEIKYFDKTYINGKRDWWVTCVYHSAFCKWINNKIVRTFEKIRLLGAKKYFSIALQGKRAKAAIIASKEKRLKEFKIEYDGLLMLRGREKKALIDEHWPRTVKYLNKIKNLLDKHDIPMIIVTYPHGIYVGKDQWNKGRAPWGFEEGKLYTDHYAFELVESYAKEQGIPFINTLDNFPKNTGTKYFFDYDGHMTPAGYSIVADGITGNLQFRKIINKMRSDLEIELKKREFELFQKLPL